MYGGSSQASSRVQSSAESESEMETVWSVPNAPPERKRRLQDSPASSSKSSGEKVKATDTNASNDETNCTVFMLPAGGGSLLKINQIKFGQALHKKVGAVKLVKPISGGKFLINCSSQKQVKLLLSTTSICNVDVTCKTGGPVSPRGVISGVMEDITETDLLKFLKKSHKVSAVQRITSGRDKSPTTSVILSFSTQSLPAEVTLGYQVFKVKQYIPRVPRCFKCCRFGHLAASCRSKVRCVRCGGEHTFENCHVHDPVCCNCGGAHSAAYGGFPH